jgi:L-ascorbate metabolism protein UlaG (beta-lactamase superfamily)
MDWWDQAALTRAPDRAAASPSEPVTLHFVPAQHFSGRGLTDRDATLWGGFVLEARSGGPIYFAGDTGMGPHFAELYARFGPMRASLLPIGAYRPTWFMQGVHISPAQAVEAHLALASQWSLGVHFGTFRLADDGEHEPAAALAQARAAAGVAESAFAVPAFGQHFDVPALDAAARRVHAK